MQTHSFLVSGFVSQARGYALGPYRPLYIKQNGEKIRNPAFDEWSQHVLNLKNGTHPRWAEPSIKVCAQKLHIFLKNEFKLPHAEFLIIPSSTQDKTSAALERIVKAICRADKRFAYRQHSLRRHKSIEKLAKGGDRSVAVHLASLKFTDDANASPHKIILDDVLTSGNSMHAALVLLEQVSRTYTFHPIVFGKTTHD